jgi:hypothetical protein
MLKLCSAIIIGILSCIGIQYTGSHVPDATIPVQTPINYPGVYSDHTEKIVWMQINNGEYAEVELRESAQIILEKTHNE